jgi:ABC-type lipoprotein export system ATPase subunit
MIQSPELMVITEGLTKTFKVGERKITVLKDIALRINKASFTVICGP